MSEGSNIITLTDSYKVSHWRQYPNGTDRVYSYFESRGGKYGSTVFFGLQPLLQRYFVGHRVGPGEILDAQRIAEHHFGQPGLFNAEGWRHIWKDHDGQLPLSIRAVPEGTVVPTHNVLMTVDNTCDRCYWLTNYVETLLVQTWYPTTVATQSYHLRGVIQKYLNDTGHDIPDFKLHDFGFRGVSSVESAGLGGAAHLLSFHGTDTMAALETVHDHYDASYGVGVSIPAAEHSTITSWGKEHEVDAFRNMLEAYPKGPVAVVSDSYDIYNACENLWGDQLHDLVMSRDGVLIVRPDSGDPMRVVPKVLEILAAKFGYTSNDKGYRVLDPHVRVIQGDGMNAETLETLLEKLKISGWSADNIAFGMGGGLLQNLNRDTQKFAFKCSAIRVDGVWRDVFKDPVTDPGKTSKMGRMKLVRTTDGYMTAQDGINTGNKVPDELVEVFRDGNLTKRYTWDDVRERLWPTA